MSLDDKLREILADLCLEAIRASKHSAHWPKPGDSYVEPIKQAFADEGYVKTTIIQEKFKVNGKPVESLYMSGRDFYERMWLEIGKGMKDKYLPSAQDVIEAAKRAAGLEP